MDRCTPASASFCPFAGTNYAIVFRLKESRYTTERSNLAQPLGCMVLNSFAPVPELVKLEKSASERSVRLEGVGALLSCFERCLGTAEVWGSLKTRNLLILRNAQSLEALEAMHSAMRRRLKNDSEKKQQSLDATCRKLHRSSVNLSAEPASYPDFPDETKKKLWPKCGEQLSAEGIRGASASLGWRERA
jgi:hypothetical protein